jgi:YD repeat-containing protein
MDRTWRRGGALAKLAAAASGAFPFYAFRYWVIALLLLGAADSAAAAQLGIAISGNVQKYCATARDCLHQVESAYGEYRGGGGRCLDAADLLSTPAPGVLIWCSHWERGADSVPGNSHDWNVPMGRYTEAPEWCQFGRCSPEMLGAPSCGRDNPIDTASANKFQPEQDVRALSLIGLSFSRYYNSGPSVGKTAFGRGWSGDFLQYVEVRSAGAARVYRPDGRVHLFERLNGVWQGRPWGKETFQPWVNSTGAHIGWLYTLADGRAEYYGLDGRLQSIRHLSGDVITALRGAGGRLTRIEASNGQWLSFDYDSAGRLTVVSTPDGQRSSYGYDGSGRLVEVAYSSSVGGGDSQRRIYHYEDSRFPYALTGITDERGIRYARWAYDAQGRAVLSEHAGGADRTTLVYNSDGTATVTNALGKQTTYHFTTMHGVRKVTKVEGHATASCAAANRAYTYTPEGWLASKTDWKGNKTTYQYNSRGLEISRTESYGTPSARTISTEWHPTLRLPVKISEPHQITYINYDEKGRVLLRQVKPRP